MTEHCNRPPAGWLCRLERDHEGPCPTYWRWWNLRAKVHYWKATRG